MLSSASPAVTLIAQSGAHDTLDHAQDLGTLSVSQPLSYTGAIGQQGLQVAWTTFTVSQPTQVKLQAPGVVLSLYNDAPADSSDQLQPNGYRLLAQSAGGSDPASDSIVRDLSAGVYHVAISGIGNRYFNPFLADSGTPGRQTGFQLQATATALNINPQAAPTVLAVDVTPLDVRVDLSGCPSYTPDVQLIDASGKSVPLQWTNFDSTVAELQLAPDVALSSGTYSVVVTDEQGRTQLTVPVQFTRGSDAPAGSHDTAATAIDLGILGSGQLVQVPGLIGSDSYYNASSGDPTRLPGNQVNFYHFQVTGTVREAFVAEVFAGRIGSPLDAGVSLYRLDAASGQLQFVTGNNNTYNNTQSTTGQSSLYFDPVAMAGLTAGDYYVVVSQGFNTPSPGEGQAPGPGTGIFDPQTSHSGSAGYGEGSYVLNLRLAPVPNVPSVTSTSITNGSTLPQAPDQITVAFSEYVNLTNLAYTAYRQTSQSSVSAVFIENTADGSRIFPRLTGFDATGLTATFQMLDRLPPGSYELHLSGSLGLTDVAGDPLAGSSPGGDFVVHFSVAASATGNPLVHVHVIGDDSPSSPQQLGTLFPRELQTGVQIVRSSEDPSAQEHDSADYYQIHLLQDQSYSFSVAGSALPNGVSLQLFDAQGNLINAVSPDGGQTLIAQLTAGDYVVRIGNWSPEIAGSIVYTLHVQLLGQPDNAPALFSGPAPAVTLRLASAVDPTPSPTPVSGPAPASVQQPWESAGVFSMGTASPSTVAGNPGPFQPRIVFPGTDGNSFVIPASRSSSEESAADFKVARNIRLVRDSSDASEDQLEPSGLTDLADTPLGKAILENGIKSESGKIRGLMEKLTESISSELQADEANRAAPAGEAASEVSLSQAPATSRERVPRQDTPRRPDAVTALAARNVNESAPGPLPGSVPNGIRLQEGESSSPHDSTGFGSAETGSAESQLPAGSELAAIGTGALILAVTQLADVKRSVVPTFAARWLRRWIGRGRMELQRISRLP